MIKNIGNHRIITSINKQSVVLNFQPLLDSLINHPKFKDSMPINFLLSHWNKILALPAYYCPQTGEYFTAKEDRIDVQCPEHFWVGIDRKEFAVLPTSCLLYPNATMIKLDDFLIIANA